MAKSIMQSACECYICGITRPLHKHHVINGMGNRENSERYGLWVYLCPKHHEMIHRDQKLDEALKGYAQREFEKAYPNEDWMSVFHKNYL